MATTTTGPGIEIPTRPETDPRFPRITKFDERVDPPWPSTWGNEPTERDLVGMVLDDIIDDLVPAGAQVPEATRRAAVNLKDYRSAELKGWGAGWPSCAGVGGNLVTVTADRSRAKFSIHRRVSVLFDTLIDRMEARAYLCKPPQCGAYNCRAIAGTNRASNHSWALAADINWTDNPYTTTGRRTMPDWVPREIFNPYGWAWGGDYSGARKDYMHLEFLGTPAQADEQTARVLAETGSGRVLRLETPNMRGKDVEAVQRVLRAWYSLPTSFVDGIYGPGTVAYVKRAQVNTPPPPKLDGDGEVGPLTRRKLGIG